jgi:putative hemolysin
MVMNIVRFGLVGMVLALASSTVACAAHTDGDESQGSQKEPVKPAPFNPVPNPNPDPPAPTPVPECTPLPSPAASGGGIGMANPAAVYCEGLGNKLDGEDCIFADGTKCEEWSFFRGECGQSHSFCNLHGGTIANGECTLATGEKCQEDEFATTCLCR